MSWTHAEMRRVLEGDAVSFAAPLLAALSTRDHPHAALRGLPYEVERTLGHGGMATVYLARDLKHGRHVAVKVLDTELSARVEAQRFVQEIRLTARLQHPHVLGLLDSGVLGPEDDAFTGRPYYVMPYLEGESLRVRMAKASRSASERRCGSCATSRTRCRTPTAKGSFTVT